MRIFAHNFIQDPSKRAALFSSAYSFPAVPDSKADFVAQKLTKRPSFFGCDESDGSPLVLYLANTAPLGQTAVTNPSTWQFTYTNNAIQAMIDQSFDIATQGMPVSGTQKDAEWPVCLACAVVDRARAKAGTPRTGACETCMARYCWSPSAVA